jgi:glycosyltransferase involved in cell wall biosynthesis
VRVLHLPVNVASHLATTVRGLREAGVEAEGLVAVAAARIQDTVGVDVIVRTPSRRSPRWWIEAARALGRLRCAIRRADVIHWHMTAMFPGALDVLFAASLGKAGVVEFSGGDIRIPEVEMADNPYYAAAWPRYEYRRHESRRRSLANQRAFARAGFEAVVCSPSMLPYLDRSLFPDAHYVPYRIFLGDFAPVYPDPDRSLPLVVHASTAPVCKGTAAVRAAVDALRGRHEFEYVDLVWAPRREALAAMARADVYLDQFVLGSHGSAAIEAMALGKPVVGYVKPSMRPQYPADVPLVHATQESLPEVLAGLLADGARRRELGVAGRAYVERHHDSVLLAKDLVAVYEGAIMRRSAASGRSRRAGARGGGARRPSPGREAGP